MRLHSSLDRKRTHGSAGGQWPTAFRRRTTAICGKIGGRGEYSIVKEKHTMSLHSTSMALLLLMATCTYGQEQPVSRHITGKEWAAGAQVIINEVNTEQYPQVRLFTT